MQQCNLDIDEREITAEEILATITKQNFGASAAVLYESKTSAKLFPFKDFTPQDFTNCLRIVIANNVSELRIERSEDNKIFFTRLLQEKAGQQYFYREDKYVLRKSNNIAGDFYDTGKIRLYNREYYRLDQDGMFEFVTDRLSVTTL